MKILILGASGMIGHKMILRLNQAGHDVTGTLRHASATYKNAQFFNELKLPRFIDQLDVGDFDSVLTALKKVNPDVILNCVGVTLRKPEIKDLAICTRINADFPHFLKKYVEQNNKYLIHFSVKL